MTNTKQSKKMPVGWTWFSKKYWKKIVILLFLATISTISFVLLVKNGAEKVYSLLKSTSGQIQAKYVFFSFGQKPLIDFGDNWKNYLLFVIIFIIVSCLLMSLSYYYRSFLANQVVNDLKKRSISKLFRLEEKLTDGKEKRTLGIVYNWAEKLGNYFVSLPDNIYIFFLTAALALYGIKFASGATIWAGLIYFGLASLLWFIFHYQTQRRKSELQPFLEEQANCENHLINNRRLIIKKGLTNNLLKNYDRVSQTVQKKTNNEFFFSAIYKSLFTYLIRFGKYFLLIIILLFIPNVNDFIIFSMFTKLTSSFTYLIKGIRKYPYYSSVRKRLNNFLAQPERNDIQQNIFIPEPITTVTLKKVSFGYIKDKLVLNGLDYQFERGKVNYFQAPNGFGKTTIINLIFGLYQPSQGIIFVNEKYKLSELNLIKWRGKIAYAESQNLVKTNLSTGQTQLLDLQETLQKEKEIYIFDEADNNLDEDNGNKFWKNIELLSQKKIVIVMKAQK